MSLNIFCLFCEVNDNNVKEINCFHMKSSLCKIFHDNDIMNLMLNGLNCLLMSNDGLISQKIAYGNI